MSDKTYETYEILAGDFNTRVLSEDLETYRLNLPEEPGVYKYKDVTGKIIYVGKARNLKKRVNSYFTKLSFPDFKTQALVRSIHSIEYVITDNEMEALLLENSLIKEHQPRYNVQLRDGKSYPYIRIRNERFPRVEYVHQKEKDGSFYFGPYPSKGTMGTILEFIRGNFKLRTCNFNLSEKKIADGIPRTPCLDFHIKLCNAPCINNQTEEDYNEDVRQVKQILKGNFKTLIDHLKKQMSQAAENLDFEKAHFFKVRIEHVQKYRKRSTVVSETVTDVEVLTLRSQENLSIVNHFKIINGAIIKTHTFDIWRKNSESEQEVLKAVLTRLIAEGDFAQLILTDQALPTDEVLEGYKVKIPTRGDELKLVKLSIKNCEVLLSKKINLFPTIKKQEQPNLRLLEQLQKDLRLKTLPKHIECFDNSNIQGYAPVSSCVVFKDGKPSKRDYRVYNVQKVEGPNDFATMYEVVTRRYQKMIEQNKDLPDLIVIDGGKGQLSSAVQALADLELDGQVAIISIAKRLEEIYVKDDPIPLYIDKKSNSLKLIQRIRDQAHETAINYHRKKRDNKTLVTELRAIKGVGDTTAKKLLTRFKSIKRIKEADEIALSAVVGDARARVIWRHYHPLASSSNLEPNIDGSGS